MLFKSMKYRVKPGFSIDLGVKVVTKDVAASIKETNHMISALPFSIFRSIDFKTTSSIVGALFCESLAREIGAIVNPIEKGHPDILPKNAINATEQQLRNYPEGVEVKTTIGNVETGANLGAGEPRIGQITGITWQAHHQDVKELIGLVWDFVDLGQENGMNYPAITGLFCSTVLLVKYWGIISGTTGRNTKVSGMLGSGKKKMGAGWVAVYENPMYIEKYGDKLGSDFQSNRQLELM